MGPGSAGDHAAGMTVDGLSTAEAQQRLAADGPNRLPAPVRISGLRRFAGQLLHFFALMLWAAAALALLADLAELAVAIVLVIVLNGLFAAIQESRADHAAERLQALLPTRITARRDGRPVLIDASEVVVGDVLLLEAGDRVPADGTVLAASALLVDTSLMTGESDPMPISSDEPVLAATFIVEGSGTVVVTATGSGTRLAGIARLTSTTAGPVSPLTLELHRVVRAVAAIAACVGGAFFLISTLLGNPASDGLMFAIGVTVALVPEALLPTVTLSLAWGAEQMAKRNVLVRHLDAVETLGSTTFVCTDKTGTLTLNEMTVVQAWTASGSAVVGDMGYDPSASVVLSDPAAHESIQRLAAAAARCSTGFVRQVAGRWSPHGDPMEVALDVFARRLGVDTDEARTNAAVQARFPFDPRRRRMSIVVDDEVLVKGAPEAILPLCGKISGVTGVVDELTALGLRVLAVATRPAGGSVPSTPAEAEGDLELAGLLAMHDPPRVDVAPAIEACRRAGIKVAMITGDHPTTAQAIADEVSLRAEGDPVLCGSDLPDDEQVLGALLDHDGVVVARVSPEDKLRIARALRARGHVLAMTGDGVNDGPALHEADVGIAMGLSGTDVAREAADLVLLDDHFASIVNGIDQGRATFLNVRRFLTYHLTDNVAELTPFVVWALSGGRFPLALGVMQILALDIGTDTLSAVALGAEPAGKGVLDRPPVSGRLLNGTVIRRAFGRLGPTVALATMVAFVAALAAGGWAPGDAIPPAEELAPASGAAFMTVVLAQTANAFACRSSSRWPGALGWTTNRLLLPAVTIELLFALTVLFVAPIALELGHAGPPAIGWIVAVGSAGAVLAVDALDKRRRRVRGLADG